LTVAIRYGATRHQFGPPGSPEIAVLDYTSQQLKLMPMLATCYALHFTSRYLVQQYAEMKRTKEEELVADVHALSAGRSPHLSNDDDDDDDDDDDNFAVLFGARADS
jgi:acyl-CoA oxidase